MYEPYLIVVEVRVLNRYMALPKMFRMVEFACVKGDDFIYRIIDDFSFTIFLYERLLNVYFLIY